jgi:hypothetical protein
VTRKARELYETFTVAGSSDERFRYAIYVVIDGILSGWNWLILLCPASMPHTPGLSSRYSRNTAGMPRTKVCAS